MDKREFAALAAAMEEYYGRNQITKSAASMDIWYELIGDIPYEQCKNAVRQLMATNNFFPSAAEIRKLCTQTGDPEAPSIDDAWGMVLKAVRAYGYMQEAEALESLPEPCRSVVKNIGWQNICRSENIMAERAFFRDSYGPKLQEMKRVGMLPPGIRQENRQRLDDQIRMAAGRLQLGGGTDGEDGRNAGGGTGKA